MAKTSKTDSAAEATVSLRNRTPRPLLFNLPCESYCAGGDCACQVVDTLFDEYDGRTGEHVPKVIQRKLCSSIGFLPRETITGLRASIKNVPEVADAIRRDELLVL